VDRGNNYSCECPKGFAGPDCHIPSRAVSIARIQYVEDGERVDYMLLETTLVGNKKTP
jgi:hypothetical protein